MSSLKTTLRFGPFRLHPTQGLRRGEREIRVTPKSLAVLTLLAERRGEIVPKEELFRCVWPNAQVTDASLTTCIRELRQALQDDARQPIYIETVHRRGYRLRLDSAEAPSSEAQHASGRAAAPVAIHGRAVQLNELHAIASDVASGDSRVVLMIGPAGIGKTTLARIALDMLADDGWRVVGVTCRRPGSASIAYGPALELLSKLCRELPGPESLTALQRYAPTWLAELAQDPSSAFVSPAGARGLQQRTSGATPLRRCREISRTLTELAADVPLAICLEDLEASDAATVEWLSGFARGRHAAPILLLATIGTEAGPQQPSCMGWLNDLSEHCAIMELPSLDDAAVSECISSRVPSLPGHPEDSAGLAARLCSHTAGLPLFVTGILDHLEEIGTLPSAASHSSRGGSRRLDLPGDLDALFERRLGRLATRTRRVLDAASVAGSPFAVDTIAAAADLLPAEIDSALTDLERAGYVRPAGHDTGTHADAERLLELTASRLESMLYERLPAERRASMHGLIARHLERSSTDRSPLPAAALAHHYEQAGEFDRAIRHLYEAGATARRLGSAGIALGCFRHARALLNSLPPSADRDAWDADLSVSIGRELVVTQGLDSREANASYARALTLQQRLDPSPQLGRVLWGSWVFYLNHGPLGTALELAERLLAIAQERCDPALLLEAHHALWGTALMRGDMRAVLTHTREGMRVCSSRSDGSLAMTTGCTLHDVHLCDHHAAVCAGFFSAWADAAAGRKDIAVASLNAAISHARDIEHPFTLAVTLVLAAGVLAAADDPGMTRLRAAEGRRIAADQGFSALEAWSSVYEGWALTRLGDAAEGLPLVNQGLDVGRAIGMTLFRPFQLALAADAELCCGLRTHVSEWLEEGFEIAERVGDGLATAELNRLYGELLLLSGGDAERSAAEARFLSASRIAESQGAGLLAERAEESLTCMRRAFPA